MLPNESYLKPRRIESPAMRRAAQGEACTVEILGVCNRDPATTVLAHLPDESHGLSRKSDDLSAAFCSGRPARAQRQEAVARRGQGARSQGADPRGALLPGSMGRDAGRGRGGSAVQMISSAAGTRLAKARAALDLAEADDGASPERLDAVRLEFAMAAIAVSDELIAQGFHNKEGD